MSMRAILLVGLSLISCQVNSANETADLADRVANWLDDQAIHRDGHVDWPIDVQAEQAAFSPNLYSGITGILLFYLEHHGATGRQASLDLARRLGETLIASLSDLPKLGSGLYTGAAGMVSEIEHGATEVGSGVAWTHAEHRVRPALLSTPTGYTQGAAGVGLFLLHRVAEQRGRPRRIILPDA